MTELFEKLAAIEHERWADWQKYMHGICKENPDGSLTITVDLVERWDQQIATPYADLSETEKESDRDQVRRYWDLIQVEQKTCASCGAKWTADSIWCPECKNSASGRQDD